VSECDDGDGGGGSAVAGDCWCGREERREIA